MVLKTLVASMTSRYMIITLALMTSTASLASKQNQKLLALYTLSDFPGIKILSSLNDLSGLNDFNSLISSKNCLNLMVLSILVPNLNGFNQISTIDFRHSFYWRLWRPWMLLSTKSKGQMSNVHIS